MNRRGRGSISRDGWGIPTLRADTVDELAYLQGEVTATDRGWQVQTEKWRSEGQLAQRLGPDEVPWDRFARRAKLDDTARRCFRRLDRATRDWLRCYVAGVNAALLGPRAPGAAAPEFAAAGCSPDPWRPWSPLGVFLVQHVLMSTFPNKLWRAHVLATLGPEATDLFAVEGPAGAGSNAWAVAGDPAAGRPATIAGDPHRMLELPGIYQQIHLVCPEFDVIGLAFPGVPGVPHFGHAGDVVWAVTHAMADYQDLYRERLRPVGGQGRSWEALDAQGWRPVRHHVERIHVAGAAPVDVEVIETPRGPVIDMDRYTGEAISLRTPARVAGRLGLESLLPLLRARRARDVAEALRHWVEPVNSVLVADRTGDTLRLVAGLVPVRDERCRREPVPAWQPEYHWLPGYAPLPCSAVPDLAVHANDRRPGDGADLGADFAPPHRARRIRALVTGRTPPSVVLTDTAIAGQVLRDLLCRIDPASLTGPAVRLRDRLLAWDGQMTADGVDAGAFAAWRGALARGLAGHRCLRPLHRPRPFDEVFAPWTDPAVRIGLALDGLVTGLHRLGGDVLPIAVAALEQVAAAPEPGPWGGRHLLRPVRLPVEPALDAAVAAGIGTVPLAGDNDAVLATTSVPGVSDRCSRGPVARYVFIPGDRAASRWVVPYGASGRPDDPHFADQLPLWVAGELIPLTAEDEQRYTVHQEELPELGRLTLAVLDPDRDAAVVHDWVTQRRAAFWGMLTWTVDQVREVYRFVDGLSTHHAYLIGLEGRPVGVFQTYRPEADPVGERYQVRPGDIGMHLLLAPGRRPPRGLTRAAGSSLVRFLFRDPGTRRVVVEPDVRNHLALRRLEMSGFVIGDEIEMPDKRARLAFLTRERFAELGGFAGHNRAHRPGRAPDVRDHPTE